jgi:hypothetical protein
MIFEVDVEVRALRGESRRLLTLRLDSRGLWGLDVDGSFEISVGAAAVSAVDVEARALRPESRRVLTLALDVKGLVLRVDIVIDQHQINERSGGA